MGDRFQKIYSVVMKLNQFLPSTLSHTAYTSPLTKFLDKAVQKDEDRKVYVVIQLQVIGVYARDDLRCSTS